MRRRHLLGLLAGLAAAFPARAQRVEPIRRIGFLSSAGGPGDVLAPLEIRAFSEGLRALGWEEGRNIEIIYRWFDGRRERLQADAQELAALAPEVVVTIGGPAAVDMMAASRSIPIVFTVVGDPVAIGFVSNLAHPGGNATGFAVQEGAIAGKWAELLKEIVPALRRVLLIMQADNPPQRVLRDAVAAAASSLGLGMASAEARRLVDYEEAITAFAHEPNGGLIILPNGISITNHGAIQALAARYRLPAVYDYPVFGRAGGLVSYGTDPVAQFPEAARYVARILHGEKPGDLPVQQPTKFTLVINLKTARALGLTVPQSLLARADEVLE